MYNDLVIQKVDNAKSTVNSQGVTSLHVTTEIRYDKNFKGENKDNYISNAIKYFNIDYYLDNLAFENFVQMQSYICHGLIAIFVMLILMIISRQLGTINLSAQRKFFTKIFSFTIVTLARTLQFPLLTFLMKIYSCDNNLIEVQRGQLLSPESGGYCYTGAHLSQSVYTGIVLVLFYCLIIYFNYFLTLSYPHEKIPWACLPTKTPIMLELLKFLIVFSYQETNVSYNALSYLNIVFTLAWIFILYQRVMYVLVFHTTVYYITIVGEATMFVIFGFAAMRDFISLDRNFVLHILWIGSAAAFSAAALFIRDKIRYKFLSKVDFALYEKDFEALIMMFTLHELIERSSYDEKQDFLLRGFIERHIEICEFPTCSCIKYYTICNQTYRLELAQMSPFSKNYDSGSMNQSATHQPTNHSYSQREASDGDELSTLKVFYGRTKSQQKQNKNKAKFLKKFLIDNINVFLEVFPNSVKLHIMAAFIYFSIFKNSFKSLYELSFTNSKKSSLQDKYECFVLSSQIIAYFQSRASQGMSNQPVNFDKAKDDKKNMKGNKKTADFNTSNFEVETEIKSVIEFEKINIKFQKMIEQTSFQTREFWQEILKKNIDVRKIFDLGAKIYKNFIDIKRKYKNLMQLNNNYLEVAYLYKLFVSLILNFEIEVEDAKLEIVKIMQSKSMKKHNLKTEYKAIQLLEENGMVIASGSTDGFGRILAMNNKAERIFGYATNELMTQRLARLMPKLFADKHEELILNFINGNRKINKEHHNFVWGKHKSGFIVPLIMDINAYVNFEFNFCFIAFLKRSILLEFKPMRELLEYQDVFVLQADQQGTIMDMTQNLQEYLNFPIQALQKDISVELLFKGVMDDDTEQAFLGGKRMEFDPVQIKRILEQEDIDVRDNESDGGGGTNFNMSEKKCTAIVWLRQYDYTEQEVKLAYREVWFVLTEDDASFLDTKNTTEYMTNMGDDAQVKVNVTYTDDREEICSIASVSSLANYDKNRKNIMAKLSEIKTQTIDDSKPRQIDLLQKAIIIVFLSVISIALLLLIVSIDRNQGFFQDVEIIQKAKEAAIHFGQIRVMLCTLVSYHNSPNNFSTDPLLRNLTNYTIATTMEDIEKLRIIQSEMNFIEFDYSEETTAFKKGLLPIYYRIRSPQLIEKDPQVSFIQGMQEFLDGTYEVTSTQTNFTFDTLLFNYDHTNSSSYNKSGMPLVGMQMYQVLKNMLDSPLSTYLLLMSQMYISDAFTQADLNTSLVLILTLISIGITFLTAFIILPILHRIERSKEKVLMIYTELKKEQIESLNRNIKVFFMKLQLSSNTVGGSLLYQNSSKQFSGKLVTRKFTQISKKMDDPTAGGGDFGFLMRRPAIGANEMENEDVHEGDGGKDQKGLKNHFPLLFNKGGGGTRNSENEPSSSGLPTTSKKGVLKMGGGRKQSSSHGSKGVINSRGNHESEDDYRSEDESRRDRHEERRRHHNNPGSEEDEDLSENAEEDKKAQLLMSKEEAENALFKRLFQNKIKQMTCMRQFKYYVLVISISMLMSGYFTLSYFMVTNIFKESQDSLTTFDTVANRSPYLSSLIAYFLQTLDREREIYIRPLENEYSWVNSLDYYQELTLQNENDYNDLRRTMPPVLEGSKGLIEGLESQDMCTWLINEEEFQATSRPAFKDELIEECKLVGNRALQLGLQQATNSIIQNILQGTLTFREQQTLKYDKELQLFQLIYIRMKYINHIDIDLIESVKQSIVSYFTLQQRNYVIAFSVFVALVIIAMILLSYNGVDYLFKNLIAIKFILNFIPGQWLIENNAADDLKYIDF